MSEKMRVLANRKSFHAWMNDSTLVATSPGATSGNSTCQVNRNRLAPSSDAASSSSAGTAATNPRSIQIANGKLNARLTSTKGANWFSPNAGTDAPNRAAP